MSAPATDRQIAAIGRMTTPERLARVSKADAAVVLGALLPPSNQSSAQRSFLWRLIAALQPNEVRDLIADLRERLGMTTNDAPIPPPYGERRREQRKHGGVAPATAATTRRPSEQGDHRARLPPPPVGSPTPRPSAALGSGPATSSRPAADDVEPPWLQRWRERHPDDEEAAS